MSGSQLAYKVIEVLSVGVRNISGLPSQREPAHCL